MTTLDRSADTAQRRHHELLFAAHRRWWVRGGGDTSRTRAAARASRVFQRRALLQMLSAERAGLVAATFPRGVQ